MPRYIVKRKNKSTDSDSKRKKFKKLEADNSETDEYEDDTVFQLDNHIYFTGDVTMTNINTLAKLVHNMNKEYEDMVMSLGSIANITPKPIFLHITSNGGDLFGGFRAVDLITNSKIPIHTIADGCAISSGSLMYLAGAKRYMTKNSYLLIHQLSNYHDYGSYETFENAKDESQNNTLLMNQMYEYYIEKSYGKLSKKKLEDILKHDLYWNYETCLKYGLVDDIYKNA